MKIKINRIYKPKGKKIIYSNKPIYHPLPLNNKNDNHHNEINDNKQSNDNNKPGALVPSESLSLYKINKSQLPQNNNNSQILRLQKEQQLEQQQSSPQKKSNNHSSSFDRFLFGISRDKIMTILLRKSVQRVTKNYAARNHNMIKSEVNPDIIIRERKDKQPNNINNPLLNSASKKNHNIPFSPFNLLRYSLNKPQKQEIPKEKTVIPSTPKPNLNLGSTTSETNILKLNLNNQAKKPDHYYKKYSRANNQNKGLCFPNNTSNSYGQISKMNTLLLNKIPPITKSNENKTPSTNNNSNNNNNNKYNIPTNIRSSDGNFDAKDIDEHIVQGIINIPFSKENKKRLKHSNSNDTISIQNETGSNFSFCNENNVNERYSSIIWNNLSSSRSTARQKDICTDYSSLLQKTPIKNNEYELHLHLHQSRSALNNTASDNNNQNNNNIDNKTVRDTLIYNNDYYNLIKKISQHHSICYENDISNHSQSVIVSISSSSSSHGSVDEYYNEDIINNDNEDANDSANEHISSITPNSSNIVPLFKTLKFSDKTPLSLSYSLFHLFPYIAKYLNIKTLIITMQVNTHLYNQASSILHRKITSIVINNINDLQHYKIIPSVMSYSPLFNKDYGHLYLSYLYRKSKYTEAIAKDLQRTILNDSSFNEGSGNINKLKNILTAYSNYNKKIGYTQGMNFIVAHGIYLLNKECDVFLFIDGFINKFQLEELYGVNNQKLQEKMDTLGRFFKMYIPRIMKQLDMNGICHEFFTSNWVLTLFSNSMKSKYVFVIWDFMVMFGWNFFYYFSVKLLQWYQKEILATDVKHLSALMKGLLKRDVFEQDFQWIIEETFRLMK